MIHHVETTMIDHSISVPTFSPRNVIKSRTKTRIRSRKHYIRQYRKSLLKDRPHTGFKTTHNTTIWHTKLLSIHFSLYWEIKIIYSLWNAYPSSLLSDIIKILCRNLRVLVEKTFSFFSSRQTQDLFDYKPNYKIVLNVNSLILVSIGYLSFLNRWILM